MKQLFFKSWLGIIFSIILLVVLNCLPAKILTHQVIRGESPSPIASSTGLDYTISPTTQSFGVTGGVGNILIQPITSGINIQWTADSNVSWISITSGTIGTGSGTVAYLVAPNNSLQSRTGTITVGGQIFTVNQTGIVYTYQVEPLAQTFDVAGGDGSITITTQPEASWTVITDVDWITITTPNSGKGSSKINYQVSANPKTTERIGKITIVDQIVTVKQAALITHPDLVITKVDVANEIPITFTIYLKNIGNEDVTVKYLVQLFIRADEEMEWLPVDSVIGGMIKADEQIPVKVVWNNIDDIYENYKNKAIKLGDNEVKVVVDAFNVLKNEDNRTNNEYRSTFNWQPPFADLSITDFQIYYQDCWDGNTVFTLVLSLKNEGTALPVQLQKENLKPEELIRVTGKRKNSDYKFVDSPFSANQSINLNDFLIPPGTTKNLNYQLKLLQPTDQVEEYVDFNVEFDPNGIFTDQTAANNQISKQI